MNVIKTWIDRLRENLFGHNIFKKKRLFSRSALKERFVTKTILFVSLFGLKNFFQVGRSPDSPENVKVVDMQEKPGQALFY